MLAGVVRLSAVVSGLFSRPWQIRWGASFDCQRSWLFLRPRGPWRIRWARASCWAVLAPVADTLGRIVASIAAACKPLEHRGLGLRVEGLGWKCVGAVTGLGAVCFGARARSFRCPCMHPLGRVVVPGAAAH